MFRRLRVRGSERALEKKGFRFGMTLEETLKERIVSGDVVIDHEQTNRLAAGRLDWVRQRLIQARCTHRVVTVLHQRGQQYSF